MLKIKKVSYSKSIRRLVVQQTEDDEGQMHVAMHKKTKIHVTFSFAPFPLSDCSRNRTDIPK